MRSLLFASVIPATVMIAAPASASTVFSENFDAVTVGNHGTGDHVGGFTVSANDVDIIGHPEFAYACPSPNSADGNHCLDLNGNLNGVITSDPLAVIAGQIYTVAFKMAGNGEPYAPSATSPYDFQVSFAGVTKTFSITPVAPFASVSFDVAPALTGTSSLVFQSISQNQPTYWGAILDDITVTTPDQAPAVPEPATWGMMVIGFACMGAAVRRRAARPPALA